MAGDESKGVSLLREHYQAAIQLLEGTMEGVTPEQAHWVPPGTAHPIGANYAHVVVGQDLLVNGRLKDGTPLFAGTRAGRTGLNELPPRPDPAKPGFPDWSRWARQVKIDLGGLRSYAREVYAATDAYLASLTDADLTRTVDLSALGLGQMPVKQLLLRALLGNTLTHCGEISCLKGLQGSKGYPF
ncbi:MAG: DinB family protein [Candidatus Rokubacteria bacterium]|nr:DinB family protein [Candidatus Rokubacteria bacterium]